MIFVAFGKGIDERREEAKTKYDDEDMAWLGISTDIIIFSESVAWNIHRYPSPHPPPHSRSQFEPTRLPKKKAKCREEGEAMNDLISVSLPIHSSTRFDEKSNKAKDFFSSVLRLHLKRARVASYRREKIRRRRRRWHKKLWSAFSALSFHEKRCINGRTRWSRQKVLMRRSCCDNLGFALRFRNEVTRGSANIDVASSLLNDGGQWKSWQRIKIRFKGWHTEQSTPLHPM